MIIRGRKNENSEGIPLSVGEMKNMDILFTEKRIQRGEKE